MTDNQNTEQYSANSVAAELGMKLRQAREQKGFSIGEVAERLKLSARQIEGLESGNYEGMPELVFVRGFLRTYARFLGLDEQEVSAYLDRIMPQSRSNVYAVERNGSSSLNYQQTEVAKTFPKWILGVALLALIGGGVYVWQSKSQTEYAKQNDTIVPPELSSAPTNGLNADNVSVVSMGSDAVASAILNPVSTASGAVVTAASDSVGAQTNVSVASGASQDIVAGASGATPVAADELLVKVYYRSKLVIKDKSDQFVINEIVPAGSEHRFKGGAPYNVWIGYAPGATVNYGGQEIAVRKHMVGKTTSSFTAGQ
ncbi:RodZ domain-containing protein [Neisseria sp. 74A18]|uniref:RodZ domain-containing protein n=1 Tax=Neisseria sp. 74A18 TaxID=1696094 RepID=UPI0006CAEDE1|nr:RodZ domain-containing protein [Neisseria sp. 74A18]KPN74903.1 hypothetical protein AKG43_00630 [Neisseria sp. 74A18]